MAKDKTVDAVEPVVEVAAPVEAAPVADARRARWEEWLANARTQRPDPTIFDAQRARGEFDAIPDWLT